MELNKKIIFFSVLSYILGLFFVFKAEHETFTLSVINENFMTFSFIVYSIVVFFTIVTFLRGVILYLHSLYKLKFKKIIDDKKRNKGKRLVKTSLIIFIIFCIFIIFIHPLIANNFFCNISNCW